MKITLRKANAIQNSIQDVLKTINFKTLIEISEFQDPEVEIEKFRQKLHQDDYRAKTLLEILYHIRGLVGQANAASGIDLNLSQIAFIDKRIQQLRHFVESDVQTDLNVIKGKLQKLSEKEDRYGRDTVSTTIVSKEDVDSAIALTNKLKKEKQSLSDKVLELNIKTEITLNSNHVEFLQKEGIL